MRKRYADEIDIDEELRKVAQQTADVQPDMIGDANAVAAETDALLDLLPPPLDDQPPHHGDLIDANFFNSFDDDFDDSDIL
ncbi:hypothetical protein Hanom_Chr17g01526511 [Helianthus anomalus]